MIGQEPVQAVIWHCLNHYSYKNAIFLAERLHAEVCSEETAFLLATCYYRSERINEAYWLLQKTTPNSSHAKFLLAKCCVELKTYHEAEITLGKNVDNIIIEFGEQAPYALQLLAKVYNATKRRDKACDVVKKALSLNPFLWECFADLCTFGEKVDPNKSFQTVEADRYIRMTFGPSLSNAENVSMEVVNEPATKVTPLAIPRTPANLGPCTTVTPDTCGAPLRRSHSVFMGLAPIPFSPSFGILPEDSPMTPFTPTLTDSNEQKAIPKIVHSLRAHVGQLKDAITLSPTPRCALGPAPRRSSRLFTNGGGYSVKENNKSPSRKFVQPRSPSRKSKRREAKAKADQPDVVKPIEIMKSVPTRGAVDTLLGLMRELGEAFVALTSFDCKTAARLFSEASWKQAASPWVKTQLARAYYELSKYEQAAEIFAEIRKDYPRRTEGLDIYGACLWHLRRESELSALARELVALDRKDPVAWLAAGNCFSLQRERDTAIKFFIRAVQLDPDAAYPHALLGHEYAAAEETERALAAFQAAVSIDPRCYGALFGMGGVYARQEKWKMAESYVKRALTVHPRSAVLRCQLGAAQAAAGRGERALATLDRAVAADPDNPLCRFHRASALLGNGRAAEALAELTRLKEKAPRESLVYYLLGRAHDALGERHLALMHYSWATDLDPKGAGGHIKEGFHMAKREEPTSAAATPQ